MKTLLGGRFTTLYTDEDVEAFPGFSNSLKLGLLVNGQLRIMSPVLSDSEASMLYKMFVHTY